MAPVRRKLSDALRQPHVGVIAEVKRRSPSKGWINAQVNAVDLAGAYHAGGAAAISVLTETTQFGGSLDDLSEVSASVPLPTLRKDFHVDPVQLYEARVAGAAAALLIVRALAPTVLASLIEAAREIDLETLVEVRDEAELQIALDCDAAIIGVNNRNLETLVIDPATSERLLGLIPPYVVAVAESGVSSRADVERLARCGADGVLVGSALAAAPDAAAAVRDLASVPRTGRGD